MKIIVTVLCFVAMMALAPSSELQSSVRLKLKLREDETVKYRHILNVTTYAPDGITERVSNSLYSFKFGEESAGSIPVVVKVEGYEGLDPGGADTAAAMSRVEIRFSTDAQSNAKGFSHTSPSPALEPVAILVEKTLRGVCAFGLLGVSYPEKGVSTGEKWERKVLAEQFFSAVLGPAGDMFSVAGELSATLTLVDVVSVNKRRHARISVHATGKVPIEINSPEANLGGTMDVTSDVETYVDLDTGLVTVSRTNSSAVLDLDVADVTVSIQELVYRQ